MTVRVCDFGNGARPEEIRSRRTDESTVGGLGVFLIRSLMDKVEYGFRRRDVRMVRLEVRSINTCAQQLYRTLGYIVTQRLPRYYSNGGDGLLMIKSLD